MSWCADFEFRVTQGANFRRDGLGKSSARFAGSKRAAARGLALLLLNARRLWKGRSIFGRATKNGFAFFNVLCVQTSTQRSAGPLTAAISAECPGALLPLPGVDTTAASSVQSQCRRSNRADVCKPKAGGRRMASCFRRSPFCCSVHLP